MQTARQLNTTKVNVKGNISRQKHSDLWERFWPQYVAMKLQPGMFKLLDTFC
jgi:hypothetical protein